MTERIDWIIGEHGKEVEATKDLYYLYNNYVSEFGHISEESFRRYCRSAKDFVDVEHIVAEEEEKHKQETILKSKKQTDSNLELALTSYDIKDVDGLVKWANVDLTTWELYSQNIRSSSNLNNPWYIIDAKFRLKDKSKVSPEEMIENFQKILKEHKPPTKVISPPKYNVEDNIALFNFYDHHIGKRIQGDSTGNGIEWTTELAKESMLKATDYFIDKIKNDVQKVWFVFGNDLLNFDQSNGATTKNTPQFNDVDYKHLILEATDLMITVIEKLLFYFPVDIIVVNGNHDTHTCFLTAEIIKHHFLNNDDVNVDNSLPNIKYKKHGEVAIGFTHGSEQIKRKYVLPMLMMQQRPDLAKCKWKEIHSGHIHQTKKTQLTETADDYGVTLRSLPTLSPTCSWASGKGYIGSQASECVVYNKDAGPIITYRYSE